MSSTTPRLGIKRPDGSDPFLRQDFVDTWNLLDANPGIFVCTSGTRPTWGSGQAGRTILETDTKRIIMWDGSSFIPVRQQGNGWLGTGLINVSIASNTSITPTLLSFTTSTPGTVQVTAWLNFTFANTTFVNSMTGTLMIDGVRCDGSITTSLNALAYTTGSGTDRRGFALQGMARVTAGSHTVTSQLLCGANSAAISVGYYSVIAHQVNSTLDGNV